jgi:hypothetical protein
MAEACGSAGYRACLPGDREPVAAGNPGAASPATERVLTVWDAPLLEPDWSDQLERLVRSSGPVIALLGFADRETVTLAKARGALACLELPCNIDDLLDVIDRTARSLAPERWPVPLRAEQAHRLPPTPRLRKNRRESPVGSDRAGSL